MTEGLPAARLKSPKVKRIALLNTAGHRSIVWDGIQPDLNLLLGRNGAGKSTVLEALSVALQWMRGRRTGGVFTRSNPSAEIELAFEGIEEKINYNFARIEAHQGPRPPTYPFSVLYWVEDRQPKAQMGHMRSKIIDHVRNHYPNTLSEISRRYREGTAEEVNIAREVLSRATALGIGGDWRWIESEIQRRGPTRARPTSCGEFDLLALIFDVLELRADAAQSRAAFVIIDNPAVYLHPAGEERLLAEIRDILPQAQIFIASHSLKMLAHREPRSVFWLSRELRTAGRTTISSVRDLDEGARDAFFELYGHDISSSVLSLLGMFISPEYFKFLCDCALRPSVVIRDDPSSDRQIQAVVDVLDLPEPRTILDFGAGNGDVLQGLIDVGETSSLTTYIALDPTPSGQLDDRLRQAKTSDRISAASRRISTLVEAPTEVDAIVLLNTCHEILLPDLAIVLVQLLGRHMRQDRRGRLIIHEMTELRLGEDAFVMWTSDDYEAIFTRIEGLRVIRVPDQSGRGVPLATTIICRDRTGSLPDDLESRVRANFYAQLSVKKSAYLRELAELRGSRRSVARQEMLRQRRVASLTAQIATICLIESAVV